VYEARPLPQDHKQELEVGHSGVGVVMAVYEARPLPQDHKQELEVRPLRSGCGDGCV
jgi:hypothetical protein